MVVVAHARLAGCGDVKHTVIIGLLLISAGCGSRPDTPAQAEGPSATLIPAVEIVRSRQGTVPLRARATGTVRAAGEVAIFPQTSGAIVEVMAQNGDSVEKGQPLVRIQAAGTGPQLRQARSSLGAAQAGLTQAQARHRELAAEYERNQALGRRGLVPLNLVDSLRAQTEAAAAAVVTAGANVKVAEAAVAEQQELQAQTTVRAPISGRVGQRNVEVGMRVDAQTPLFLIGRLEDMRVEVPVTQDVLTQVREGQRVELRVGGQAAPIEASVSRISPFLQQGSFSAEVEIDVPNDSKALVPGMFVTADIFYGESGATTLVPTSAVYEDPATGEQGVFVTSEPPPPAPAADGATGARPPPVAVPFRRIDVVAEADQIIGVTGVKPGEWVVVVGQHLLASQGGEGPPEARVRTIEWDRIIQLQQLQRQDLLDQFLERQRQTGTRG
jgi:RND family efflux transporter MFP subunit